MAINLCSQEEWAFSSFHFYAYHSLRSYTQIIKWSKIASNNTTKSLIGHFFDDFHRVLVEREGFWVQFVRKKDILQVFLLMSLKKHVQGVKSGWVWSSTVITYLIISHVHRVVTSYRIQLSLSNISPLRGTYWITKTMSQSMYFYLFHAKFQFSVGNQSVDPQTILSTSTLKNRPFFCLQRLIRIPDSPGSQVATSSGDRGHHRRSASARDSTTAAATNNHGETPKHQNKGEDEQCNNLNPKLWLLPYNKFYDSSTSMMTRVRRARQRHRKQEL